MPETASNPCKYGILQGFWMSFYSRAFYRDAARNRRGWALGFLLLLIVLCMVPRAILWQAAMSKIVDMCEVKYLPQIPVIRIQNGKATVEAKQPYYLFPELSVRPEDPVFILDTTGQTKDLTGEGMLLKETELLVYNRRNKRIMPLAGMGNWNITQENLRAFTEVFRFLGVPFFYVGAVLFLFAYKILAVLVWALAALGLSRLFKVPLQYDEGIRLSVFAQAPVYILSLVVSLTGSRAADSFWLFFLVALAYVTYAVFSLKPEDAAGETTP